MCIRYYSYLFTYPILFRFILPYSFVIDWSLLLRNKNNPEKCRMWIVAVATNGSLKRIVAWSVVTLTLGYERNWTYSTIEMKICLCSAWELSLRRGHKTEIDSLEIFKSVDDEQCMTFDQYLSPLDCQVRCCPCRVLLTSEAVKLSDAARIDLLVDHNLYVSPGTRIFNKHVFRNWLHPDVVVDYTQLQPLSFSAASTKELINDLIFQLCMVNSE